MKKNRLMECYHFPLHSFTWIENKVSYFIDQIYMALFSFDFKSKTLVRLTELPWPVKQNDLSPVCVKWRNNVYCLPLYGDAIWYYHLSERKWEAVAIESIWQVRGGFWFGNPWMEDENICAYMSQSNAIFSFDTKRSICKTIKIQNLKMEKISHEYTRIARDMFFVSTHSPNIYKWNLDKRTMSVILQGNVPEKFSTICFANDCLWMSGFDGKIYYMDLQNKKIDSCEYTIADNNNLSKDAPKFYQSIFFCGYVWFIPGIAQEIIKLDPRNGRLEKLSIPTPKYNDGSYYYSRYIISYCKDNRYLGIFSFTDQVVLEFDAITFGWKYVTIRIDSDKFYASNRIFCEEEKFQIDMWRASMRAESASIEDVRAGNHIYMFLSS